jgi:cellulose synthase operon protein C
MTAAWTTLLLALSLLAGSFSWPGARQADGRAVAVGDSAAAQVPASEAQRLMAIDRLIAVHGMAAATPFLLPLLADREPSVRLFAARLLARAGSPVAGAAATAWIVKPAVPLVDRAFGLDVLGLAPTLSPADRTAIEQAMRDPEAAIRLHALEALERHPIGPSLPVVLGALDDDNRDVRLRAVRLAEAAGDPRAALALCDRLDDADRQVRLLAISALGRLADLRAAPALLRLVDEGTVDERTAAIDALGTLKATAAAPRLIALGRRAADDLARHAILALGEIATPAAIGALVGTLRTPPVPAEATIALRHAGAAATSALVGEVERGGPSAAALAAKLLGQIGDRHATFPLCAVVERGGAIGLAALEALAGLADPAAVPTLARAAESPDAEIRQRAFMALLSIADPRSVAVLEGGLVDPDPAVRVLAARLAARIDARGAAPALAARLADGDPAVRRAAAEALARVADASSQLLTSVLAALTQSGAPPRDDGEAEAIGDALERIASATDARELARAFALARGGARAAVAHGLAAAHVGQPISDRALIDQLIVAVGEGGLSALAAGDALAVTVVPAAAVAELARAFGDAEPMVRARLCPAIAGTPDGGAWLAALIEARDEAPEVRAAAAWAARGRAEARKALEGAAHDGDAAVARNAEAALGAPAHRGTAWAAVRLRAPDGAPLGGRWVTIEDSGGIAVLALTDSFGVARVTGLPGGRLDLRAAGSSLRDGP